MKPFMINTGTGKSGSEIMMLHGALVKTRGDLILTYEDESFT